MHMSCVRMRITTHINNDTITDKQLTRHCHSVTQPPLPLRIRPEFKFRRSSRTEQEPNVVVVDTDEAAIEMAE